jgi:hypothetical protein|eukprot:6789588-Prymnesium_polylepis.1
MQVASSVLNLYQPGKGRTPTNASCVVRAELLPLEPVGHTYALLAVADVTNVNTMVLPASQTVQTKYWALSPTLTGPRYDGACNERAARQ